MNKKQITTACGFAAMVWMPVIATTASNDNVKIYPFFVKTGFKTSKTPDNYASFEQHQEVFSVADVIQEADKTLGLSKQHLAQIFLSSRQNLLNNPEQVPSVETENRAKQVGDALKAIRAICPYKLGASSLTVRIEGKRLFDVLTADTICLEQVKNFADIINKRITQQSASTLPEHIVNQEEFLSRPNAI